mgnify:CR=1 FL=1
MTGDHSAFGFDPGFLANQFRDAARCVAAGFHFAAIGIEYLHPDIGIVGGAQYDQLITADPAVPVRDGSRLCSR